MMQSEKQAATPTFFTLEKLISSILTKSALCLPQDIKTATSVWHGIRGLFHSGCNGRVYH